MNLEELNSTIKSEIGVLLYFSGENCNVCHALRPKISRGWLIAISKDQADIPRWPTKIHKFLAHFRVFSVSDYSWYIKMGREF